VPLLSRKQGRVRDFARSIWNDPKAEPKTTIITLRLKGLGLPNTPRADQVQPDLAVAERGFRPRPTVGIGGRLVKVSVQFDLR
jgi:hypothetical protein